MSDSNKSLEVLINEINVLRKENEELKKKLSVYEKEEAIKNTNALTAKWKNKYKPQMSSYEKQQMQITALNSLWRRQAFRDNYM